MFDQHVLTTLRGWAAALQNNIEQSIEGCYVFGSLVNAEGRVFSRDESDIDLIILTAENDAQQLVKLSSKLAPKIDQLEELLKKALGRKDDELITSTTLVTKFEIEQGIHKDRNSRIFFATKAFLSVTPLPQLAEKPVQIGDALADDLVENHFSIWTVMANTQLQRNT